MFTILKETFDLINVAFIAIFVFLFWIVGYAAFDSGFVDTMAISYPFFLGLVLSLLINNVYKKKWRN